MSELIQKPLNKLAKALGAALVGYARQAAGAVNRTLKNEVDDQPINVKQFGVLGDGSNEYTGITAAWVAALIVGKGIHFPQGVYSCGANNFPFKNTDFPASSLMDCKNITISGEGPATILRTDSVNGADVLNLYSVKNLHFKNLGIKGAISGSSAGSNGISIVAGFDNLTFNDIWIEEMPFVEKAGPSYLDGGKAFTIQTGTPATQCGTIRARNIYARGCVHGFGLEVDLVNFAAKKHAIDIEIVAEDCYQGVQVSAGEASGPLAAGLTMGALIKAQTINCQRDIVLSRAHGVGVEAQIITTKTAAARRLSPKASAWASYDSTVDALLCNYAKNSIVAITGDKGGCDYIAQMGGTTDANSGLTGATEGSKLFIDVKGAATVSAVNVIDVGGNSVKKCDVEITNRTTTTLPVGLYTEALENTVTLGSARRMIGAAISGKLNFQYTNGQQSYNYLERDNLGMYFGQNGSSNAAEQVFGVKNNAGAKRFFIRNDGAMGTGGRITAANAATIKGVLPIYDESNVLYGYVPVYTTYS